VTSKTSRSVVADANVLLSVSLGHAARKAFQNPGAVEVFVTDVAADEVREYLPGLAGKYHLDPVQVMRTFELLPIEIVPETGYRARLKEAERLMSNRDPDDAPTLALALERGLPIWSNDGDFDHTGITVYPTAVLLKILGFSSARRR
jgi:predicted nucleic acid-binding protein